MLKYDRGVLEHIQARLSETDGSYTISQNEALGVDVSTQYSDNTSLASSTTDRIPDPELNSLVAQIIERNARERCSEEARSSYTVSG
jgi:hypothetical protein